MECISISHKTAGADLRQRFAFAEQEAEAFVRELTDRREIGQAVLLSTCNRTELYVQGETGAAGAQIGDRRGAHPGNGPPL